MESLSKATRRVLATRFSQLSPPRQRLVRLCQATNFGSIEDLEICDAEPVFIPPPSVLRDIKLDEHERPREEFRLSDFELVKEMQVLMRRLDELRITTIRRIEVRAGIPRRLVIEDRDLAIERTTDKENVLSDSFLKGR